MNPEPKIVEKELYDFFDNEDLYEDLDAFIGRLKAIAAGQEYPVKVIVKDGYYSDEPSIFRICVVRPETRKEIENRLTWNLRERERITASERALYEKLKSKYEGNPNAEVS